MMSFADYKLTVVIDNFNTISRYFDAILHINNIFFTLW